MNDHETYMPDGEQAPISEPAPAEEAASGRETAPAEETAAPTPKAEFQLSNSEFTLPEEEDTPVPAFRWSYDDHATLSETPKRRGAWPFAILMSVAFLVSFALLIAVIVTERVEPGSILRPGITADHDDTAIEGVEQAKHFTVVIETTTPYSAGTGTGIILTKDGYIATNHHVIEDADTITVTLYDGRTAQATLVGSSEMDDLAVIKIAVNGLTPAVFAEDESTYVGQTVYAIGTPASVDFAWTTTKGVISYKDREVKLYDDDDVTLLKKLRVIQTDANVNPGNSGGPLINTKGEVVGVVSMKLADGYEGIGFAIPADGAVEILTAIMEGNLDNVQSSISHKRPMLGIVCVSVQGGKYYVVMGDHFERITEDQCKDYEGMEIIHPTVTGVYVREITEGMDAIGKIQPEDIITAINGIDIQTGEELTAIINEHYAGDTVTITFWRNGLYNTVEVTLSAQPD